MLITEKHQKISTEPKSIFYDRSDYKRSFLGNTGEIFDFIESFKLCDNNQWDIFAKQFVLKDDSKDNGWRGEFWGKLMRGSCFIYSYTKNEKLYGVLTESIKMILQIGEETRELSSYKADDDLKGWDLWCRKYYLLGLQYYLEICKDNDLIKYIIEFMCNQMDVIMQRVGEEDGKMPITHTSNYWLGVNSASMLEPVVRLYRITGEESYLNFAKHIVKSGANTVRSIFDYAYEDDFYPYQYPVTKAYEVISCFDGMLELYLATGEEKYKTTVVNFGKKLLESDFTIIGGCGCTGEMFDHSSVRQANGNNDAIMQETCVTVTVMKLFMRLQMITGDSVFADAFEVSLYNAYMGAVNTNMQIPNHIAEENPNLVLEPLPFDSYSPLIGKRGNGIGGFQVLQNGCVFGCCASIGAAGAGIAAKGAVLECDTGVLVNLYISGSYRAILPSGNSIKFKMDTEYPRNGTVKLYIEEADEGFLLMFRIPFWSRNTVISVNGEKVTADGGYSKIFRHWKNGDIVCIDFEMNTRIIKPVSYNSQILTTATAWGKGHMVLYQVYDREEAEAKKRIALCRGPIVLTADDSLGYKSDDVIPVKVCDDGYAAVSQSENKNCFADTEVLLDNGETKRFVDYAFAGADWNSENKLAVWIKTK